MKNGRVCLAAAEAAGARGEPGNRILPLTAPNSRSTDSPSRTEQEEPCL
jgi:hypothetical protein